MSCVLQSCEVPTTIHLWQLGQGEGSCSHFWAQKFKQHYQSLIYALSYWPRFQNYVRTPECPDSAAHVVLKRTNGREPCSIALKGGTKCKGFLGITRFDCAGFKTVRQKLKSCMLQMFNKQLYSFGCSSNGLKGGSETNWFMDEDLVSPSI